MAAMSVSVAFLILVFLKPSPGSCVPQVLLESSPDTSEPVCPDVPLVFTCNATELGVLNWFRDGTSFFSIAIDGSIILDTPPDGLQVVVNSVQPTVTTTTDFNSTLTVDNATLVGGSEICCGQTSPFTDCAGVTLLATSAPTIASIREETVKSVTITLGEPAEGSECVEDYIIQYEGRSMSTGGTLSVVIEDAVLYRVAPITFNVTAVLRDGSLIDGSESNFTLTGETLGTITGVNVIGSGNITIEWMEPDPSCDCIKKYIIESTGAVLGSSPCGNPQYVCDECRCEEHSLTVTPDLRNRIRVESSRSDPVIVGKDFPVPIIADTLFICSEKAEVIVFLQPNSLSEYPDGTIEVTYSRDADTGPFECGSTVGASDTEICCKLDFPEYDGDEVFFNVTFRGGGCVMTSYTSETIQNIIGEVTVSPSTTTVEITVSYNDCTEPSAHNLTVMSMYYKTQLFNDPENIILSKSALFPEDDLMHKLQLTDLDPGTNYTYTILVVRTSDGETIGVPQSGTVTTRDASDGDESQLDTAAAVAITALVMFTTGVIVGVLVVYCTARWRRSRHLKVTEPPPHHPSPSSQRPPVYEEVTERGGIPVSENAAYGPVPPPERIELRENVAYGPV